jgi:hypothetical protein
VAVAGRRQWGERARARARARERVGARSRGRSTAWAAARRGCGYKVRDGDGDGVGRRWWASRGCWVCWGWRSCWPGESSSSGERAGEAILCIDCCCVVEWRAGIIQGRDETTAYRVARPAPTTILPCACTCTCHAHAAAAADDDDDGNAGTSERHPSHVILSKTPGMSRCPSTRYLGTQ